MRQCPRRRSGCRLAYVGSDELAQAVGTERGSSSTRRLLSGPCRDPFGALGFGEVTALFYEQATYHHWGAPQYEVVTRVDVLDNVFGLAPHGTAIGYKMEGSNVEAMCAPETEFHAELVDKLGTAVELFCKNNSEYVTLYSDDDTARELIDALVSTWCFHPNKSALKALDHIMVTDGTSAIPSQPLFWQPWRPLDTAKTLIPGRLREKLRIRVYSPVWPEAAFHRSGKLVEFVF